MKISRSDPGGITTYYTSQLVISRSSETLKDHIFKDCKNLQRSVVKVTVMLTITCSNLKALTPAKTHILKTSLYPKENGDVTAVSLRGGKGA